MKKKRTIKQTKYKIHGTTTKAIKENKNKKTTTLRP